MIFRNLHLEMGVSPLAYKYVNRLCGQLSTYSCTHTTLYTYGITYRNISNAMPSAGETHVDKQHQSISTANQKLFSLIKCEATILLLSM